MERTGEGNMKANKKGRTEVERERIDWKGLRKV
jgi:hypothetical protein